MCGFLYILKYTFPVKEMHKYCKCVYYVVVTMSEKTPNLIIYALKNSLDAAENSLKEEDHRMALLSFRDIKEIVSCAEETLRSLIFQESNRDLIHKPTLDRLAEWIGKYKESRNGDLIVNGIMDVILEQMELMKDAPV